MELQEIIILLILLAVSIIGGVVIFVFGDDKGD